MSKNIEIRELSLTKKDITKFVKFGIDLYKGNDCYVPPLVFDEVATFLPDKNPAFDFCEAALFMAYRDGKPVGRVAAMVNKKVNERTGKKEVRFGNFDFIDDMEVSGALLDAVAAWGKKRGLDYMIGPMGFTDMDHEGMLTFGFDELGTMATIYNYPYYPQHLENMGFEKAAEWVEYRMTVPDKVPDKYMRIADIVSKKYGLKCAELTNRKLLKERYGKALFDLINRAYDNLFGYSPLTDKQIEYYIEQYLGLIRLDCICVIVDKDDKLVGIGISMPSLSRALQKSGGKLFPFGWIHLLKAIKGKNDIVDLMLVAIEPEYQNKGVNALLFSHLLPNYIKNGYEFAESNLELEDNTAVQLQWQYFDRRLHRRRRCYGKAID
ncbi:MAG: N-acetyltransferase [Paramuribaculum sp.]|nr:N-acetyltransferase [Paramuribaculum sp.]